MRIIKVADDVFQFAPEHCDGLAVWMKSGFSGLYTAWSQFVADLQTTQQVVLCEQPDHHVAGVSRLDHRVGGLFQVVPPFGELQRLYLYPNPQDHRPSTSAVAGLVKDALTSLNRVGCRFIAMNGIHGANDAGHHSQDVDAIHAGLMMSAIRDWYTTEGQVNIERVYLVDINGWFGPAERTPLTRP